MRSLPALLPLLFATACTSEGELVDDPAAGTELPPTEVPVPTEPGTTPSEDPRFDRSTWPSELGGSRPATVLAPQDWDGTSLLPVVVLLHGYTFTARWQDQLFQLSPRVDAGGFLLILPEGNRDPLGLPYWNATPACCDTFNENPDDEGYLRDLLTEAEDRFPIDPDRIVFTGHSNGGFMSYRMACAFSDRIAGIAVFAGLSYRDEDTCQATDPVNVLHMHGTADLTIPYDPTPIYGGAEQTLQRWGERAHCTPGLLDDGRANYDRLRAGDETERRAYAGCDGGASIALWTFEGSGHVPLFTDRWSDDLVDWMLVQRRLAD